MAKATLRPADDTSVAAQAPVDELTRFKDSKGRQLAMRQLTVLEEMRLLKILGEHNSAYYNFCAQVAKVAEIDGQKIAVPNSEREIEAVAARLGKDGVAALMDNIFVAATTDVETEREQIKK